MSKVVNLDDYRGSRGLQAIGEAMEAEMLLAAIAKLYRQATGVSWVDDAGELTYEFLLWVAEQPRPNPADVLTPEEMAAVTAPR